MGAPSHRATTFNVKHSIFFPDNAQFYASLYFELCRTAANGEADTTVNSPWTQTCISQADCILLVGLAEGSPAVGEYERFMLGMKSTARKELVLLHTDRYTTPGSTRAWLRNRV